VAETIAAQGTAMIADAWRIAGGKPLHGRVALSGSKNGALPSLAATLLLDGETILRNVPRIADVLTMLDLLRALGLEVTERSDGALSIVNQGITSSQPPDDAVGRMRASHYLLGPVALRTGRVELAMPGGCDLGARPVTHILAVLEALGMKSHAGDHQLELTCSGKRRGAPVILDPVHRNPGATFTGLMAASVIPGITAIENASFEPDVVTFCEFLTAAGAKITGAGSARLAIEGVASLTGVEHRINSDRLEAGTFFCAAAATRGDVLVERITRAELGEFADTLTESGVELAEQRDGLRARCSTRPRAVSIVTNPFPSFPTDLQPPMGALLATAEGTSTIHETVYDQRLRYLDELAKMGAEAELADSRHAVIRGTARLSGAEVSGGNIRDGAALVVAALGAEGESIVSGRRFVDRGYEHLEEKLRALGADIEALAEG
jgi:UDP-N-acetylglucosamine 1-carboxyvinyltransferase